MLFVVVLLALSLPVFSQNDIYEPSLQVQDACLGFWGKISCFLFGNPENRAGQSWFERSEAIVGEAAEPTPGQAKAAVEAYNKGREAFSQKNYQEALKNFQDAQVTVPGYAPKYYLAQCYYYLGDYEKSKQQFQEYVAAVDSKEYGEPAEKYLQWKSGAETYLKAAEQQAPAAETPASLPEAEAKPKIPITPEIQQIRPAVEWNTQRINKALACFHTYGCEGEKITYAQAYELKSQLYASELGRIQADEKLGSYAAAVSLAPEGKATAATAAADLKKMSEVLGISGAEQMSKEDLIKEINDKMDEEKKKIGKEGEKKVKELLNLQEQAENAKWQGSYFEEMFEANMNDIEDTGQLEGGQILILRDGEEAKVKSVDGDYITVTITDEKGNPKDIVVNKKDAQTINDDAVIAYQWLSGKSPIGEGGRIVSSLISRASSYSALSNLLMPETTKQWRDAANSEAMNRWSGLIAFMSAELCGADEAKRSSVPGQGYSFVRTQSGTYQFVGSIQAEKSLTTTPLLCMPNEDPEAEEEFVCSSKLLCREDQYCYENEDAEEPAQGYFYKITWGISAPADEAYTPFIDEDGKAVRFNLLLSGPGGQKWIFKRADAMGARVLALENGASDGGTIVRFLKEDYNRVCVIFDPAESIIDYFGEAVSEICADFVASNKGVVEYGSAAAGSGGATPPVTSTSENVEMDI